VVQAEQQESETRILVAFKQFSELQVPLFDGSAIVDQHDNVVAAEDVIVAALGFDPRGMALDSLFYEDGDAGDAKAERQYFGRGQRRRMRSPHLDRPVVFVTALMDPINATTVVRLRQIATSEKIDPSGEIGNQFPWFHQLFWNAPLILSAIDTDNRICMWNPEAERISGYTSEEVLAHENGFGLLYPPEERAREVVRYAAEHQGSFRSWEVRRPLAAPVRRHRVC
jgi:PAS domain-containing protein